MGLVPQPLKAKRVRAANNKVSTLFFMFISIPFAALKAQNVMKRVGFERYFIYPINVGIAVNYKPRGGEWATPNTE
ncbi:hypothetical protein JCM17380_33400 [Desulfosporosinus burensis]